MVSKLLVYSTFIILFTAITSIQEHSTSKQNTSQLIFPSPCPQKFFDLARAAVLVCEKEKLPDSSDCIADEMRKYKLQCWNVMVKTSDDVADTVSYWAPGSCTVKLQSFGQLNRSYLLWQSLNYNNDANLTSGLESQFLGGNELRQVYFKYTEGLENQNEKREQMIAQSHQISHLKSGVNAQSTVSLKQPYQLRGDCEQWKTDSVKNIVQYCDLAGNDRSGQCIRDRIKNEMAEYWSVYVKTTTNSAITIWFAECYTTLQGYGTYIRYIRVWA